MKFFVRFLSPFLLVSLILSTASAQSPDSPGIHGTITDTTHARIQGATISVSSSSGVVTRSATSDQGGEFNLALPPGDYVLSVSRRGFKPASVNVHLPSPEAAALVLELPVASANDIVTVVEGAPYAIPVTSSATKTATPLIDIPQSVTVVTKELIHDQMMDSIADVVNYIPGITMHQGENNRDQLVIRGNSTSADFYLDGVRDDVQYYRDLYNLDRVEALKGPNAMTFGRGGAGGVINRVTKEAEFTPLREFTVDTGSFFDRRFTADFDQPLSKKLAVRLNGMYEGSDTFRDFVDLTRYGVNPTLTFSASDRTKFTASYENLHDQRVADRGIPSFAGLPVDVPISTYYGDPDDSNVHALVNLGSTTFEHVFASGMSIHNRSTFANYDRGYQNFVPGAVTPDESQVALSAYNNATNRTNLFNQTDVSRVVRTGNVIHTLLGGVEIGRQLTDNFKNTGYFNNTSTSILIPFNNTVVDTPVTFRQSATDANNHLVTNLAATYFQDQAQVTRHIQVLGGVRYDYFDLQYHNNRTGDDLRRIDRLVSPRAGVVIKPRDRLSLYGSYSVSYLPSSGDQFSSLTTITQQVKPEKFTNYEAGAKWDVARTLSLTTAVYQLNRTNTRSTDPNDPTRIVQTGSTRTNGVEVGANGNITRSWQIAGGYAYQNAYVTSATTAAVQGAKVALVPHNTFSLWNNYRFLPRLSAGLGILNRTDMFAAIDDSVVLPGYTRADAAVFYSLTEKIRLQVNVENLLNKKYYLDADNNNNISPGSSRAIRAGMIARF